MSGLLRHRQGVSQRKQVWVQRVLNSVQSMLVLQLVSATCLCRFKVALQQFSDSLQMVKNQITPGKLTWPLTKEIVKETQPDYFKVCAT